MVSLYFPNSSEMLKSIILPNYFYLPPEMIFVFFLSDEIKHHNVMVRREAFSEWLENVITETTLKETSEEDSVDKSILSLLSGIIYLYSFLFVFFIPNN